MKKIILLISLIVLLSTFVYSILPLGSGVFSPCPEGKNWVYELDGWNFDFKPDSLSSGGNYPSHFYVVGRSPVAPNGGATFFTPQSAHLHLGSEPSQNNALSVDININSGSPPTVTIEGTGKEGVEINGNYPLTGSGTEKDPYTFSFMSGKPPEEKVFKVYCK